jgi:outer membrane protein TolC
MKNSIKYVVVSLLVAATFTANAQQTLPINLQTVLEMGGANNLTIKEFKAKQELAAANLSKAKEWWLPDVYAGLQTNQLWGAAMNADGRFFLDVNRQNLWSGLGLNTNWNFAEGIYKTKSAKLQVKAAFYDTQAERNNTLLATIKAYYDLQTAQMKLVAYKNLVAQSDTITQQISIQVEAGLRYQSELLLSKSNQSHLKIEMLNAKTQYNQKSSELVRLLNLESKVKLVSIDSVMLPLDFKQELIAVNDSTYKNRPEIKAIDLTIRSLQTERKTITTGLFIPTLNIGTYGSYFGRINGAVKPMFPSQYPVTKQLYPTGMLNASLTWNIPIGRLIYGGELKQYNSHLKIQEIRSGQFKAQINEEIVNSDQQLIIGKEQIEIAKEALNLSSEALNQSMERQKLGTVKPFEVFQAQQFFLQAQIDYLKGINEYNKSQFALKVAKGEIL